MLPASHTAPIRCVHNCVLNCALGSTKRANQDSWGGCQTVNARDLHAFLEVKQDFSNWIKKQIERARLVEGRDYIIFAQKGENTGRGRSSLEYHLTIEAAKHIAMMSGCDKGFEVRDYFLECERIAKQPPVAIDLNNPEFLRATLDPYKNPGKG